MTNELLSTGLVLSAMGGLLYYCKSVPENIYNKLKQRFFHTVRVHDTDKFYTVLEEWLNTHYFDKVKEIDVGYDITEMKKDNQESPTSTKKVYKLGFRQSSGFYVLNALGKRLLVRRIKQKMEGMKSKDDAFMYSISITGFLAKNEIIQLLQNITTEYNETLVTGEISFYIPDYTYWELGSSRKVKPLSSVILEKETKNKIITNLEEFKNKKDWYEKVGIVYKKVFLLHGPPGTGKTTLSTAIAAYQDRDVYLLNIGSISESNLQILISRVRANSIILIEDIDSFYDGRKQLGDCKISFSTFINMLDGAATRQNVIFIITTNHPEKLDPALVRPGRIDENIEIPLPSKECIEEFLELFYSKKYSIRNGNYSIPMSFIQEVCLANKNNPNIAISVIEDKLTETSLVKC